MSSITERLAGCLVHFGGMKTIAKIIAAAWLLAWLAPGQAAMDDLYAAEVPVADDTLTVRNQGLRQAMRQVLVRLSGRKDVGGNPAVENLLERAPSLVQQFRYRLDDPVAAVGKDTPQRYLWARFDESGLGRMMRSAGIPVWRSNRPRVLIWLAEERNGQRQLLNLDNSPVLRQGLLAEADKRGMPLQLPLMDLLDQSALSAADLWAGYEAAIREASNRYPHDVILTGRLRNLGGRWEAQWTLWDRNGTEEFSMRTLDLGEALVSGIDPAQDSLAARYAPVGSGDGPGRIRVRFNGIDSLPAYGRLMQIIREQDSITRVDVRGSNADALYLDLWVRGGESALVRVLSLGGEIFQVPPEQQPLLPAQPQAGEAGNADASPVGAFLPTDLTFNFLPSVAGGR